MNISIDKTSTWTFPNCPTAPDWQINWNEITARFSSYHININDWIHLKLGCEELVARTIWRSMNTEDRSILFAATLLSHIANPIFRHISEDSDKRQIDLSVRMVRRILQDLRTPFTIRERIISIVRYQNLPLCFWDKFQPLRSIIKASQLVRCDWLALVAEVDICSRTCENGEQLLATIEFFREFCQEHNCLDRSYPFGSDLSRFIYFHKEDADPTYVAYDDTRLEVILMCGLPGTGKDYWIEHHQPDLPVISLDKLREEMGISPTDEQGKIIQAGRDIAKRYLQTETPFIWNATNIVKPIRSGLIRLFASYRARIRIVYLEVPIDRVLRQNRDRKNRVPNEVIHRYRDRLEIPDITESHQLDCFVDV
jgi:predicted kinase